ncbi:MAG: hypothetical protein HQM13_14410 [SAR324 cluster bacterium]|nr:hypothetical protein [SAR324 cluster bacterium]
MSQNRISLKRIPFNFKEEQQISGLAFWLRFVSVISVMIGILQLVLENPLLAAIQLIGAWFLWNGANKLILVIETDSADQDHLVDAILNLGNYFAFKGVLIIIGAIGLFLWN